MFHQPILSTRDTATFDQLPFHSEQSHANASLQLINLPLITPPFHYSFGLMSAPSQSTEFPPNPDMADVYTAFDHHADAIATHKRKRFLDDCEDSSSDRDIKRRSIHSLPIRTSPSRPQIAIPHVYSLFTSVYQQPPTPVDTSEDESPGFPRDDCHWPMKQSHSNASLCSQNGTISSTRARPREAPDVDMELSAPSPAEPRVRRARSNDIVPPHRDPNFLGVMDTLIRDRVPTPISSHFDRCVSDLPKVPRHQFPPLRTNLSPMFEQESWITRDGLPSPVEDPDMDSAMMIDETNDSMSGLRVSGGNETVDSALSSPVYWTPTDGNSSPGRLRTARLHMGFLNGCEKCIQKVPGHYSHILRS